jgi:glycolate oxidase
VAELGTAHEAFVSGCGHVGDGNVHLAVFQPDTEKRKALTREIFRTAIEAGGAVSGEHGIGTEKMPYFLETEDPMVLELMRRIKQVFDPRGILGPGRLLGPVPMDGGAR